MEKLNRYEQYRALQSLESIANSLSILAEDTKERKIALKKHNELVEGLETSILDMKENPFDLKSYPKPK